MITLKNDFHNTVVTLRPGHGRLSPSQVARSRRALCGIAGCTCGGWCGERGPQSERLVIEPTEDGGAELELELI